MFFFISSLIIQVIFQTNKLESKRVSKIPSASLPRHCVSYAQSSLSIWPIFILVHYNGKNSCIFPFFESSPLLPKVMNGEMSLSSTPWRFSFKKLLMMRCCTNFITLESFLNEICAMPQLGIR